MKADSLISAGVAEDDAETINADPLMDHIYRFLRREDGGEPLETFLKRSRFFSFLGSDEFESPTGMHPKAFGVNKKKVN